MNIGQGSGTISLIQFEFCIVRKFRVLLKAHNDHSAALKLYNGLMVRTAPACYSLFPANILDGDFILEQVHPAGSQKPVCPYLPKRSFFCGIPAV
jgi:hypothetical protein